MNSLVGYKVLQIVFYFQDLKNSEIQQQFQKHILCCIVSFTGVQAIVFFLSLFFLQDEWQECFFIYNKIPRFHVPISRYKGLWFCPECVLLVTTLISLKKIWSEGLQMGQRGRIAGHRAVLVLIGNGHKLLPFNQRSAASLKRICAAYSFPREQGEHKAYVDPHQACMDPRPAFACSLGSRWAPCRGLCAPRVDLFWWWVEHTNAPLWKPASVPSLCFFWSYIEDTSIHSFPPRSFIQHLRIYYMQGIGFMLWRKFLKYGSETNTAMKGHIT